MDTATTDPRLAGISYRFEVTDRTHGYSEPYPTRRYLRVTGATRDEAAAKVHAHYCDDRGYRLAQNRRAISVAFLGYNINSTPVPSLDVLLSVESHGDGWEWTVQEYSEDGDLPVMRYRTDSHGQGLWQWRTPAGGISPMWIQDFGHMQYSVAATTPADATAEIARRNNLTDRSIAFPGTR